MKHLKTFTLLLAVLTLATACKDDDDDNQKPDETEQTAGRTAEQQADLYALATVLNTLTGQALSDTTDIDFEGQTFEPTYGEVLADDKPFERAIKVRSAAAAESYFRLLVGSSDSRISETADGYTIDMTALDCHSTGKKQSLGTLTFHREGGRNDMGYAEVSIPCIPHLRQIDYKTRSQMGKNAAFESPCAYGDVFVRGGKYYICVKESEGYTANAAGKLVAMEAGKGTGWRLIDDYEDDHHGLWLPEKVGSVYDITLYMLLCADEDFLPQKKRIVKNLPGKVFPYACYYRNGIYTEPVNTSPADEGFGTTKRGYSHWLQRSVYYDANDLSSGILVARDAGIGSYVGLFQGWWRNFHFVKFPPNTVRDKDVRERTYSFTYKELTKFNQFLSGFGAVYTCTVVSFNDTKPDGFSLVDI